MRTHRGRAGPLAAVVLGLISAAGLVPREAWAGPPGGTFAENPIVYFVITDRFLDGNPANDGSYGRARERDPAADVGTFHGGDLAGLSRKVREGWFRELGVNAIWITAPYEQIHGWVVGGQKEFKHYAYHGYWALDFTRLDANMGNEQELRDLVDAAHAQGIRILFDVVMNHPGYGDLRTLSEYVRAPRTARKLGVLWAGFEAATLADYHGWIDYNDLAWTRWWGRDWVRAGLRGYEDGGRDDHTKQLAYLPDFKTESPRPVELPPLLGAKPDTGATRIPGAGVRQYLVAWLTRWVAEFGVDGFRCDTVKHVEPESWRALKAGGVAALRGWKQAHPAGRVDDADFWMTGEWWGHGVERSAVFDAGFDSVLNFGLQDRAEAARSAADLEALFASYAKVLAAPATHNVLSYLSSHDTRLFARSRLLEGAEALLLAPGGVQIFYGDETARPEGPSVASDRQQATRSDMNWGAIDERVLSHWRTLGRFRARHVALARGRHLRIAEAPYTFGRVHPDDRVVVALGLSGPGKVVVRGVFEDGARLREAYRGVLVTPVGGEVEVTPGGRGVVLLERAP